MAGYDEGLRVVLNVLQNPGLIRQLQNLPGAAAKELQDVFGQFRRSADAGLYGPEVQQKIRYGGPPAAAPPIPTKATESTQLPLPLKTASGRPVTSTVPRPTSRNLETIRAGMRPRAVDVPPVPRFGEVPGQMPLDAAPIPQFTYKGPHIAPRPEWGPEALPLSLRQADSETLGLLKTLEPGTADSIARLADDLAGEYGVPAGEALKNITGPRGTDYLAYLNTSRKLAVSPDTRPVVAAAGDSGIVPPAAPMGGVPSGPGGALIPSPAGGVGPRLVREVGPEVLDVEFRTLRELPGGSRGGAVPSATQDLATISARTGLTPAQLAAIAGGAGVVGLSAGLLRDEEPDASQRLSDAEAFPQQRPSPAGRGADLSAPAGDRRLASPGRAAASRSVVGQTGSGQVVVPQDDRESNYRQARANALAAVPKAPSEYAQIADYYKARQQYAAQPEVRAELARQAALIPGAAPQTPVWAAQNPALAYEMIQRSKARPDLSQQTPQAQGLTVGAQMGDNVTNNFVGNVESAGSSVVDRSSGAADLEDATRPLIRPTLNRAPTGGRLIPLGGGYVGEAGRYLGQAAAIS